ncbi:MAG: hypothetical protein ABI199_04820 [Bacteroidia bacterium]
MKKTIFTLALTAFIAGTIMTGCSSSSEKANTAEAKVDTAQANVNQASKNLKQAEANYTTEYNAFKLESDRKIATNDSIISELKEDSKKMKKAEKARYEQTIDDLEAKNQAMKNELANYKEEDNDKWETFKLGFNHEMDNLQQALKDLTKSNTNNTK